MKSHPACTAPACPDSTPVSRNQHVLAVLYTGGGRPVERMRCEECVIDEDFIHRLFSHMCNFSSLLGFYNSAFIHDKPVLINTPW